MSSSLATSAALAVDRSFGALVQAAVAEHARAHPNNALSRALIRDPGFMGQMFVAALADDATLSTPGWSTGDAAQKEADVRGALSAVWSVLADAVPNVQPTSSRIPVLDADPDGSSSTSLWVRGGVLHVRGSDEQVYTVEVAS